MMADSWIVKLDADKDDTILIKVTPKDSNTVLDLDLLATNGDKVYDGKGDYTLQAVCTYKRLTVHSEG